MRAGRLRHQITIQKQSTARDSYGEIGGSWTSGLNTWAEIKPLKGAEYFEAQQIQSGVTHQIIMRYQTMAASTAISTKHRIKFGSKYYGINSIINVYERNMYFMIMAEEKV